MTVADLIEKLQAMPADARVVVRVNADRGVPSYIPPHVSVVGKDVIVIPDWAAK